MLESTILIKNNYFILKNDFCDKFCIIIYFLSENLCRIKARRIDHHAWGQDLKIVLHDINYESNDNYENISMGSSDKSIKIMEFYTKITLIPFFEDIVLNNIKIPKTIISYSNESINSNIYTYNCSLGIIDLNILFKYKIFNKSSARNYILGKTNKLLNKKIELLDDRILKAFDIIYDEKLKEILFKYIYLYYNGGCYIPVNTILNNPLSKIIYDEINNNIENIKNNIILDNIENIENNIILDNIENIENNIILDNIENIENNIILDKYNKDCIIVQSYNIIIKKYISELCNFILNKELYKIPEIIFDINSIKIKDITQYEENNITDSINEININILNNNLYESLFYVKNKIIQSTKNENFIFYFLPTFYKDTFIIYNKEDIKSDNNSDNIYVIKRTDDTCGWGQNLNIKAINNLTNKIHYINIGSYDSNEKIFII
jgi:hypothetical protein